ncbi:hypothetical protein HDE_01045 [Halotydeus destructor]|nr:hypothetical protein HDE_01045 [Halotydeus destructor]
MTATINPILYQLMSLKFRLAFKDTFGCWCPFLKPPEKHPDYTYSTVMVNGTALNGPESRFGGSFRAGGSFRGSISAHQLNNMPSTPEPGSKRVGEPRGQVGQSSTTSSVIKCANNGNGSSTLLTVPSGPMTGFRSTSCTDVFPSNNGGRRCLIQSSSPTPSTVTFEEN